jgi:hypothetical protein
MRKFSRFLSIVLAIVGLMYVDQARADPTISTDPKIYLQLLKGDLAQENVQASARLIGLRDEVVALLQAGLKEKESPVSDKPKFDQLTALLSDKIDNVRSEVDAILEGGKKLDPKISDLMTQTLETVNKQMDGLDLPPEDRTKVGQGYAEVTLFAALTGAYEAFDCHYWGIHLICRWLGID